MVVLEIGLVEGMERLAIETEAWLEANGSRTTVVLTADIDRQKPKIKMQMWQRIARDGTGPLTHNGECTMARIMSEVNVIRENSKTTASEDLVIPFEAVFNRSPRTDGEGDIMIPRDELVHIAELVWKVQGITGE